MVRRTKNRVERTQKVKKRTILKNYQKQKKFLVRLLHLFFIEIGY